MNTGDKNVYGRTIYRGPRGGEYTINPSTGRKVRVFKRAAPEVVVPVNTGGVSKKVAKYMKIDENKYISRYGDLYNKKGKRRFNSISDVNAHKRQVYTRDPKYLFKPAIPFIKNENFAPFLKKLKLKNGKVEIQARNFPTWRSRVFYNKNGELHYVTLNGRKNKATSTLSYYMKMNPKIERSVKRSIGRRMNTNYPRGAIPPNSPNAPVPERAPRNSPTLLENMMNRIYIGGRGANINASVYTTAERDKLIRRLTSSIQYFKSQRDIKKGEASNARVVIRATALPETVRARARTVANAANERVGYFDDAVRAYTRGLRALKPLSGVVTPRARAMPATPNRFTPAPASENTNAIYMPLEHPHLVVKIPGVRQIYLNPNTFRGLVKNSARVNIPEANVRNWLRTARRNFPDETLFRHPLASSKNVTASHIRFSRS
jgi:hypothetical protein